MRIEKVCNGWIVWDDMSGKAHLVSGVLGVFNHLDDLTVFIRDYYLAKVKDSE